MVLTEAIISTAFGAIGNKIVDKLEQIKPKDVQTVKFEEKPEEYSITLLDKATTTSSKWTNKDNPNMEFKNELKKKSSTVKQISIIPDTNFKTSGKLLITIDDVVIFKSKSFGAFEDVAESIIQINKTISQESKVKIFMVNNDNATNIGITAQVTFGE